MAWGSTIVPEPIKEMNSMRPVRTIAAALLVASIAVAGCSTRDTSPPGDAAPSTAAPATPAPDQPTSDQPTSDQPAPRPPVARPPSTAEAVATAVSFMRREVGMAHPVAGPFRRTGATTGQVDIHASSSPAADVVTVASEPVTTVSLQRLRTVWYVTGTRTPAIQILSPQPRDAVRSPVSVLGVAPAAIEGQVRVRVTRDRYGKDIELGSGSLTADSAGAGGEFSGEIAFARPSGTAGSVVFTVNARGNGQVAAATVVRVRFATNQPPRIQQVITTPKLSEMHGRLLLPDRVEIQVFATGADRARLVLTPTGTAAAYHSEVVAETTPAEDGLYLVWRPHDGVIGSLTIQVAGPGGSARHAIGDVYHE